MKEYEIIIPEEIFVHYRVQGSSKEAAIANLKEGFFDASWCGDWVEQPNFDDADIHECGEVE